MAAPKIEKSTIFLQGDRVRLRPFAKAEIPTLTRWVNDPRVRQFVSLFLPQTEKQEEEWFDKLGSTPNNITLGIETNEGVLIGSMGVHGINWKDRVATTGALIGEKNYWGKGYGTDAKMALLEWLFDGLGLHKMCSAVIAYNTRSLAYSLKCGYKVEGRRKRHIFSKGRYWDRIELAIFRKDWLRARAKYQRLCRQRAKTLRAGGVTGHPYGGGEGGQVPIPL